MLQVSCGTTKTATGLKTEHDLGDIPSVRVHKPTYLLAGTSKYTGSTPRPASEKHGSANCFGLRWGLVQMPLLWKEDLLLANQDKYLSSAQIRFIPSPWKYHFFPSCANKFRKMIPRPVSHMGICSDGLSWHFTHYLDHDPSSEHLFPDSPGTAVMGKKTCKAFDSRKLPLPASGGGKDWGLG